MLIDIIFITFLVTSNFVHAQDECLAVTLYHESRGEPVEGQRAVLDVIQNRSLASLSSSCSVIKAHKQFSFVNKKTSWQATEQQMEKLEEVKKHSKVLDMNYKFYHSVNVSPSWSKKMKGKKIIGQHVFGKL